MTISLKIIFFKLKSYWPQTFNVIGHYYFLEGLYSSPKKPQLKIHEFYCITYKIPSVIRKSSTLST